MYPMGFLINKLKTNMILNKQLAEAPDVSAAVFFTATDSFAEFLLSKGFRLTTRGNHLRPVTAYYHGNLRRMVYFNANGSLGLTQGKTKNFCGSYFTRAAFNFWLTTAMDSRHEVQFNRFNIIPS